MKPLSLNISQMKKKSSDKDSTTFEHPDGHEIKVAHGALSAIQRKQIEKMPVHKYADGTPDAGGEPEAEPAPAQQQDSSPDRTPAADAALPDTPTDAQQAGQAALAAQPETDTSVPVGAPLNSQPSNQTGDPVMNQIANTGDSLKDIYARQVDNDAQLSQAIHSGKLDPNRFVSNMGVGNKIKDGIALLLGGIGAAKTGGVNPAWQYLNKQIDNDIEAQKSDKSDALNLWKIHAGALQNETAAAIQAKNNILEGAKYQLQKQLGEAPGPAARARGAALMSQWELEQQRNNAMLAYYKKTGGQAGTPGSEQEHFQNLSQLQMMNPELYKDQEAKTIPGLGVAGITPTPGDKEALGTLDKFQADLKNATDFQKNTAGLAGAWTPTNRDTADRLKAQLVTSYGLLNDSKRPPSPETQKLYEEVIGNIGSINPSGKVLDGLNQLNDSVNAHRNVIANDLHVTPFSDARHNISAPYKTPDNTPLERKAADGKIWLYDPVTKKPIGRKT
jgi:hypothetical protein